MDFLYFLQNIQNPFLDFVFKAFTFLGEQYFIMLIFCWLAWFKDKDFAHKTGFAFCMGMGINQVLKLIFCIQRPWVLDDRIKPNKSVLEGATGYSFPSGHTQSGVTVFGSLAKWVGKNALKVTCIVLAILVGVSRLYFGVHTPADVITSFIIGAAVIFIAEWLFKICKAHDVGAFITTLLISFLMVVFATLKPYPTYHSMEYSYDCIKIAGAIGGFIVGWFADRRIVKYEVNKNAKYKLPKTLLGIVLLLIIKVLFKAIPFENYFLMYFENFVLILWCVLLYPIILKKIR